MIGPGDKNVMYLSVGEEWTVRGRPGEFLRLSVVSIQASVAMGDGARRWNHHPPAEGTLLLDLLRRELRRVYRQIGSVVDGTGTAGWRDSCWPWMAQQAGKMPVGRSGRNRQEKCLLVVVHCRARSSSRAFGGRRDAS